MRWVVFCVGLCAIFAASLFSISCEKHHLGEYPEVQRDRLAQAKHQSDAPAASPTPVKFFPDKKTP